MFANQLVYSIMITIVIITTGNGKCLEVEQKYPIITVLNTSVNAIPGMLHAYNHFLKILLIQVPYT